MEFRRSKELLALGSSVVKEKIWMFKNLNLVVHCDNKIRLNPISSGISFRHT